MVSFQEHYPPATQGNTQILYANTHEYILKMAKTSELHNTINRSFSSLVLSLLETLASYESLDSESRVKADSIWLSALSPDLDCLRKHLLYIQYRTFILVISEAFQPSISD